MITPASPTAPRGRRPRLLWGALLLPMLPVLSGCLTVDDARPQHVRPAPPRATAPAGAPAPAASATPDAALSTPSPHASPHRHGEPARRESGAPPTREAARKGADGSAPRQGVRAPQHPQRQRPARTAHAPARQPQPEHGPRVPRGRTGDVDMREVCRWGEGSGRVPGDVAALCHGAYGR